MIESADIVLVATNYHKKLIEKYFNKTFNHIVVEKFPVFIDGHQSNPKEDIVVFPHRLAEEKQPHLFSEIKAKYEKKYNTLLEWVRTIDVCKNKTEYYELLSKAKISLSFALQETFGIAMLESQNLGCVPLVPNRLSYKETIHSDYLYNTLDELVDKIYYYINNYKQPEPYKVNDFNNVIGRLA